MGNNLLIIIFLLLIGCSSNKNIYSNISEKNVYGPINYPFNEEDVIDVSGLMMNQSFSNFFISSASRFLTLKVLNKMNSLSDINKEKHLKAIYIAVNYLEVGKKSIWMDKKKKVDGEVKIVRRFYVDNNQCVSYRETIARKKKINIDYITACNIDNEWVIKNV